MRKTLFPQCKEIPKAKNCKEDKSISQSINAEKW